MLVNSLNFCDWRRDILTSGAPVSLTVNLLSNPCSSPTTQRRLMMCLRLARKTALGLIAPRDN